MTAIVVEDLLKCYGHFTAVENVSFEIAAGQVAALLGPNGAGKTTTIEVLEGFLAPSGGKVRVLGVDPRAGSRAWRARIGFALQANALDSQLTVTEALKLHGGLYPRPRPVGEVLEMLDMANDARTRIGALSGGQRQRVDLGVAVIGRPEMLFLDEPTGGLDPEARRRLWTGIEDLAGTGTTVLLATHNLDEAQHLADRVIVLAHGRVVADTTPHGLRAMGGVPVIRFPVPPDAPELPYPLAQHVDRGMLSVPSADVTADLKMLVEWARENEVDLTGLEVGPPTLEDAYLAITGRPRAEVAANG